jgi:hypothetical protein
MSSVTVFIVPPLNVVLEIGNQFLWSREGVGAFNLTNVPMIAFPKLVVVTENAFATNDVGEPILEAMG